MQRTVSMHWWTLVIAALLGLSVALVAGGAQANEPVLLGVWGSSGSGYGQFTYPAGIAIDSAGRVYVTDWGGLFVQRFDSAGNWQTQWGGVFGGEVGQFDSLQGVAINNSGQVYVVDTGNHRIQRFNASGGDAWAWGSYGSNTGEFRYPRGIAIGSDGHTFVADEDNDRIQVFTADGSYVSSWNSWFNGVSWDMLSSPYDVGVTSDEQLYVVDQEHDRVVQFTDDGTFVRTWGSSGSEPGQFDDPAGVAVSKNGHIYVADASGTHPRVQRFDNMGNFESMWGEYGSGEGQFAAPLDVAVNGAGVVYVPDTYNHRIQRFFDYESWVDPAFHYLPGSIGFDSDFTLDAGKSLSVPTTTSVTGSWLRVAGGSLYAKEIALTGGVIYFSEGYLGFDNLEGGLLYIDDGAPLHIEAGMSARPDALWLNDGARLLIYGGEVTANGNADIAPGGLIQLDEGELSAGGLISNYGELVLDDEILARVAGPLVDNHGVIRGSGRIRASLTNAGGVRVAAGERLHIGREGDATHSNTGRIDAIGNAQLGGQAELEFDDMLINSGGTGLIAARNATLRFNGGMANTGALAFSFGTSDVFGDIDNRGSISLGGGAEVSFYDDIAQSGAGTMVIAKTGGTTSKAVTLGSFNGEFMGGGELFALGDLRPGNSAAAVTMGGDLFLGPSTNTLIEIGGLTSGSEYDVVTVTGDAALDGDLIVSLIDPLGGTDIFVPQAGDSFEILTAGDLTGTFATESFPAIPGKPGLEWLIDYDTAANMVSLTVTPIFEADFDEDLDVDGDDLARWEAGYASGTLHTQGDADLDGDVDGSDFLVWQQQFGSIGPLTAVPEPTPLALLTMALVLTSTRRAWQNSETHL